MRCEGTKTMASAVALLFAMLASGCGHRIDYGGIDPVAARSGPRCRTGATLDAERGCVGDLMASGELLAVGYQHEASTFVLQTASLAIDGQVVFLRDAGDVVAPQMGLFEGRIPVGAHVASLRLVYRGQGTGAQSYLNAYRYEIRSFHEFTLRSGQPMRIVVTGFTRGDTTTPLADRLGVRHTDAPFTLAPASGPAP